MITEKLGEIYSGLEEKFFGLMDSLEQKGLPVYNVINPLEEKGIPVFPASIALIVLIVLLVGAVFLVGAPETNISFKILDQNNTPLTGVKITAFYGDNEKSFDLFDEKGNIKKIFESGSTAVIKNIRTGTSILFIAEKDGYVGSENKQTQTTLELSNNLLVNLRFRKDSKFITGKIILVDAQNKSPVTGAVVTASLMDGTTVECSEKTTGEYECIVSNDSEALVSIKPKNYYEPKEQNITFKENQSTEISLEPKSIALEGKTRLILKPIDAETKQPITGTNIRVYDSLTEVTLFDDLVESNELPFDVDKGSTIRVVVSKQGYVSFDSSIQKMTFELRAEQEAKEIPLMKGGNSVRVEVYSKEDGLQLIHASVQLFNLFGEKIGEEETDFSGSVQFNSLNPDSEYIVTAYSLDYLPQRKKFNSFLEPNIKFELSKSTSTNSGILNVLVVDSKALAANNASVLFYEDSNGMKLPLGLPSILTDLDGKVTVPMELNLNLIIYASKNYDEGSTSLQMLNSEEEAVIYLTKMKGVKGIDLTDLRGNWLKGTVKITDSQGNILFEGNTLEETIWFDSQGNDFVNVEYTSEDGVTYSEEVDLRGKEKINLRIPEGDLTGLEPKIEFKGLFNENGTEVKGLKRGETGTLKFTVQYPEGNFENGFHVRVGSDEEVYVDSMDEGITGFLAADAKSFFGRIYTQENQEADYANEGTANESNKFLELIFSKGGTKEIKVKVTAKETGAANSFEVHYRAWTNIAGKYLREPIDSELAQLQSTETKSPLYAETKKESFLLFNGLSECSGNVCASFRFENDEGEEIPAEEFIASKNKNYALIVELIQSENSTAKIKASTDKSNPLISFNSTQSGEQFQSITTEEEKTRTEIETPLMTLTASQVKESSVYFEARETGNTFISVQIISGKDILTKEFHFPIEEEKELDFSSIPEPILFGQDFKIKVEGEETVPLTEAELKIYSEGKQIKYIKGNDLLGTGKNGLYEIKNSFDSGLIEIEVKHKGYSSKKKEFEITKQGIIQLPKEINLIISKNEKEARTSIEIKNISGEIIDDITAELKPAKNYPSGFNTEFGNVLMISPNSKQSMDLIASYDGIKEAESGTAEIIVKGKVKGKYSVSAKTKLNLKYNPAINPECLEFSEDELVVYFTSSSAERESYANNYTASKSNSTQNANNQYMSYYDAQGYYQDNGQTGDYYSNPLGNNTGFYGANNYEQTQEIQLTVKNKCSEPVRLSPQVIPVSSKTDLITIQVDEIDLSGNKGTSVENEQTITVKVTNNLMRNYPSKKSFKFNIEFKSSPSAASIPLEVVFWDASTALNIYPRNIDFYLATSPAGERIPVTRPVFLKNTGEIKIEDIGLGDAQQYITGTTRINVMPNQFNVLEKGTTVSAGVTVIPENNAKTTIADKSVINVQGRVNGKLFDFGAINVFAHVNPENCLKVTGQTQINFQNTETTGAKIDYITLKNTCLEEVMVQEIRPNQFGLNSLIFNPNQISIMPGETAKVSAILNLNEEWDSDKVGAKQVYFLGYLPLSNTWIESDPVQVNIKIGKQAFKDEQASSKRKINLCETEGKEASTDFWLPEIASSASCDVKYCDAELMAEYLVKKIEEKVNEAKNKALSYQHDAEKASCKLTGYCSFADLGVTSNSFNVYLMHDKVSTEILRKTIEESGKLGSPLITSNLGNIDVRSNQISINGSFTGCGRYQIKITGNMAVEGNTLNPGNNHIFVEILQKDLTEQCSPKIQNIMNFLPKDKGLSVESNYGTMLGVVTGDAEFEKAKETLATNLFGSKERASDNGSSNKLDLVKGTREQKLLELEMHESSETSPITIQARILDSGSQDEKTIQGIADEAAKVMDSIAKSSFKDNICIDVENNIIKAKGYASSGVLSIKGNPLSVTLNQEKCTEITVSGKVTERIKLTAEPEEGKTIGIAELYFKDLKGEKASELELKTRKESETYEDKIQLCAKGTNEFFKVQGKINITAESTTGTQGKAQEKIEVKACAIHPTEIKKKILALTEKEIPSNGKVYFIPYWSNELKDGINLNDIEKAGLAEKAIKEAKEKGSNEKSLASNDKYRGLKIEAKLVGMGACMLTAGALGAIKLGIGALGDMAMYCVVPTAWEMADYWSITGTAKNAIKNVGGKIKELVGKIPGIGSAINFLIDSVINPSAGQIDKLAEEVNQTTEETPTTTGINNASAETTTNPNTSTLTDEGVTSKPEIAAATTRILYEALLKKETNTGFLKTLFKKAFYPTSMLKSALTIGKGLLSGGMAIIAGTVTEKYWLRERLMEKEGLTENKATEEALNSNKDSKESPSLIQIPPTNLPEGTFVKGQLYSASIIIDKSTGAIKIEKYELETELKETNPKFIESCNPAEYNKPFYLLKLYPNTTITPPIRGHQSNVLAYYNQKTPEITLGELISGNSDSTEIAAMLATVSIWKNGFGWNSKTQKADFNPTNLFGNNKTNINENITYAKTKLTELYNSCNKEPTTIFEDAEIECVLQKYDEATNSVKNTRANDEQELSTWVSTYKVWASYTG
ncbi:MAG: hypothetical protein JW703_01605 [Candidatus Diapherotrites archaeon]|nr:hypothetical protein [Candidatus Diapherotrites archaeon]